ncbi:DUF4383 domain-containing protein [Kribbella sp. CA-247076]|uniref:DUF4383 domain-containing protein n=1 Tax=Kribbella sp. CA-247076 TaxID=3239941 RepID=UPI003D8C493A
MVDPSPFRHHQPVQAALLWVSGGFIALGIFGFVPGITTSATSPEFAGADSEAYLFGIFHVSVVHNVVHLATGLAGLIALGKPRSARTFLAVAGVAYGVLAIYGWLLERSSAPNVLPVNDAGDWLHFGMAFVMIALAIGAPGLSHTERRGQRTLT